MQHGVLLLNLGTPSKPTLASVYAYLASFLSDKRVIDIPSVVRYPLVFGLILPFRVKASTEAYQSIWDEKQGSPLRYHTEALVQTLQSELGEGYAVRYAMRYGYPDIAKQLRDMIPHCDHISIIPLFPQYASSSTGSAIAKTLKTLADNETMPSITLHTDYFDHPNYIAALVESAKEHTSEKGHWLMSFHGLPERHIKKSCLCVCQDAKPCPTIDANNRYCYRAQCYQTARLLANALQLKPNAYQVSFQSRLGKAPWIKPYTDEILVELRNKGIEDLTILCPSFTADCLETIEEIGMAGKEQWKALGGRRYTLIPCLNQQPKWIACLKEFVLESTSI